MPLKAQKIGENWQGCVSKWVLAVEKIAMIKHYHTVTWILPQKPEYSKIDAKNYLFVV